MTAKRRKAGAAAVVDGEPRTVVRRERSEKWVVVAALEKAEKKRDKIASRLKAIENLGALLVAANDEVKRLRARLAVLAGLWEDEASPEVDRKGLDL